MAIGPAVRAMFGRHERRIADLFRGLFMDLADYRAKIGDWGAQPARVLEVGCGEGAVTEMLAAAFPKAAILAIDITERVGRLYGGRSERVEFRQATIQQIAAQSPGSFDLIVLSDVIHHIPAPIRGEVLAAIGKALAPGGRFILKDWGRSATPIHWLGHGTDRWLTGDRVAYLVPDEAKRLVLRHVPDVEMVGEGRIRPWSNNYALVFAR